jgi:protein TonB
MQRLFEQLVVSRRGQASVARGCALPASLSVHAAAAAALVAFCVLGSEAIPEPSRPQSFVLPELLPQAPPAAPLAFPVRKRLAARPAGARLSEPPQVPEAQGDPDALGKGEEVGPIGAPCGDCVPSCDPTLGGLVGPPLLDPPALAPALRVGLGVEAPRKLRHVTPVYPEIARQARIQGTVVLECTLDPQGRVAHARVLGGPPLLDAAALAAVRQWVYTPTRLNGVPVAVILTVTLRFKLG